MNDLPASDTTEVDLTPRFLFLDENSSTDFKLSLSVSLVASENDYDSPEDLSTTFEYYPLQCVDTLEHEVLEFCKSHEIVRSGCISILFTSMESLLSAGVLTNDVHIYT